ncbi:uncharacterized protein [Eucyclogobius newberryi]|uniref:uncharacterized protein isoform X2 n=1 Tax=Eucyclogobius newberryi TaxID=166745 RepID=UPI003B5C2D09
MENYPVEGGVLIVHQFIEEKHHYEVKSVIKNQREAGKKYFLRGDKLRLVNNTKLEDMDPEQLSTILAQGSPMLTVHKTIREKEPVVEKPSEEEVMVPTSKEERLLLFNQEMRREEDPGQEPGEDAEQDNLLPTEEGEEDVCEEEGEPTDYLVVSMKKTTISVMVGRGCSEEPCHECRQTECHYNDIVMVTESSSVTLVPRGGGSLKHVKTKMAEVEHKTTNMFIHSLCSQKRVYMSQTPELINIYYYKTTQTVTKGLPVVLNFSGSDCFLKCCKSGICVRLYVETCEKQKLKNIALSDQNALAYVFYMKSERTGNITFESARHPGWFIQSSDPNSVEMKPEGQQEEAFFHIIIQQCRL